MHLTRATRPIYHTSGLGRGGRYRLFFGWPSRIIRAPPQNCCTCGADSIKAFLWKNNDKMSCKQQFSVSTTVSKKFHSKWQFWSGLGMFLFRTGAKHPPKLSATQTYGQGPEGTLTIGFEDRVKEWHAQRGSRCTTSNTSKLLNDLTHLSVSLLEWKWTSKSTHK